MAFTDLTQKELVAVAEMFGTTVKSGANKATIMKELELDGIDYQMYENQMKLAIAEAGEDLEPLDEVPLDETELVLVEVPVEPVVEEPVYRVIKMTRKNETYQINGYTFKQDHPYALVKEEDADYLVENIKGFRPATGKEIREFYAN